jgi:hypothetical protein
MRKVKITYWGKKAEVFITLMRGIPPMVFAYGETKVVDLPFNVKLSDDFVIEEAKKDEVLDRPIQGSVIVPRRGNVKNSSRKGVK